MKGFLDISNCARELNDPNWKLWENTAKNLPELIRSGYLRKVVDELPVVKTSLLKKDFMQLKRAYTIVTFISHGYIRSRPEDQVIKVKTKLF